MMIIILLKIGKALARPPRSRRRLVRVWMAVPLLGCANPISGAAQQVITVGAAPSDVVIADWNRDGWPDLAVATGNDVVAILLGTGNGLFGPASRLPAGSNPTGLAAADLDEDGAFDLVVANHETDYVSLYRGDGAGRFAPFAMSRLRPGFAPHPHVVATADMDRDGHIDLLVDHREAGGILLLRGDGTGRFDEQPALIDMGGDPYRGMALGDLDDDGWTDLVTPNPREVGVALNVGGNIRRVRPVPAVAPFTVSLADMNGDGRLDLITSAESGPTEIRFGQGEGRFADVPEWMTRLERGGKNSAVGDFDGDGIDDVVVSSYFTSELLVVFGSRESFRTARLAAGTNPWGLAVGDLNGDKRDDLVVADSGSDVIRVFLSL